MPASDEEHRQLQSLGPSAVVEIHAIHLHRHLAKHPLTI